MAVEDGLDGIDTSSQEKVPFLVEEIPLGNSIIRLVGSSHGEVMTAEELGNAEAIGVETGHLGASFYENASEWARAIPLMRDYPGSPQYSFAFAHAQEKGMPIFGIDMPLPRELIEKDRKEVQQEAERGVYSLLAALAVSAAHRSGYFHRHISRRTFLGGMVSLGSVGAYLFSDSAAALASVMGPRSTAATFAHVNAEIKDWKGLNQFIYNLRDLVMAHKISWLAENAAGLMRDPENKIITIPVGLAHMHGLKKALLLDAKQREQFIAALIREAEKYVPQEAERLRALVTKVPAAFTETPGGGLKARNFEAPLRPYEGTHLGKSLRTRLCYSQSTAAL